ncbi:MAG: glycosyltransferase family 2 protein, partial [Deltaproteobacteria bacterium]|nr:glycosyltransferase family 2 protein [Deltaproteobacteria bacterium]
MKKPEPRPLVSVVIPVYNEASNIELLMRGLDEVIEKLCERYSFEVIFVNDGSNDETYDIITSIADNKKYVKLIDLSRNFGNQIAVSAGINEAKGDIAITMDGDLQHPPAVIPQLLSEWEKGYEVVQAKRVQYRNPSFVRNILSIVYFYIMNHISSVKIEKDVSDFRLMDRKAVEYFKKVTERRRFVRGIVNWLGFRRSYIEYRINPRLQGNSTFSIRGLFNLAMAALTSFSLMPLKIASLLGVLITTFSSVLLLIISYSYFFVNKEIFRPIAFFAVLNALMGGIILV